MACLIYVARAQCAITSPAGRYVAQAKHNILSPSRQVAELLSAAKVRWLRTGEVAEILFNYRVFQFQLSGEPPVRPSGERPSHIGYLFPAR